MRNEYSRRWKHMIARSASSPLPARVQAYIAAVVRTCAETDNALVSVILFGSAATGGFSGTVSDVDLILVLQDGASPEDRRRVRDSVTSLEIIHGLRQARNGPGVLEAFVERVSAHDHSFFVCTRGDLLSGSIARVMNLNPAQAFFVDRIVILGILSSAVTVWGEELLAHIPLLAIRRLDIFKAFFGLSCQVAASVTLFPLLPGATRYAMAALKHSVHSCYFCYRANPAALEDEIDFFQRRLGPNRALEKLLTLRHTYTPSFAFVARCMPALMQLHLRTALDNRFPRKSPETNP
jgi:predicted nucleotidyltransferase